LATSTTTEKPERDYEFNPSDDNSVVLRPTPPRPAPQPRPTQRPTQPPRDFDSDSSSNINQFIPVGCPAAMNCTQVEFCTAQAVISKTQVVLTPQQQEFRVPMTDCRDLEKGFIGKCCRDPDYTDPWPVGQLGQYNEEAFGFKPERSQNIPPRPRTGESELSRPRPSNEPTLTATTNQFLSRVPSPQQPSASSTSTQFRSPQPQQNAIPTQTKTSPFQPARPTANIPTSTFGGFDQVPGSSGICGVRNYVSSADLLRGTGNVT
jgi:Clip-domain serine protease homolog Scarface